MVANFKNENKIIIVGADRAEALLIQQLVGNSKESGKALSLTEFYDIDGDVNGMALELKDVVVEEPEEEPAQAEVNEG